MRERRVLILLLALVSACKPADAPKSDSSGPTGAGGAGGGSGGGAQPVGENMPLSPPVIVKDDGNVALPNHKLTHEQARRYMLALINRDRRTENLPPVVLDEGPPTRAGQEHAEDMAHLGYLGHWGSDGSVPEQRLTRAGGADFVMENASCFTDEKERPIDPSPQIDPADVEHAESMFFNEKPPNDGHRRNILKPQHTRVGIGVAQPSKTPQEIPVPCFSQEFVDSYGTYDPIPARAKLGATIHVSGKSQPAPTGVGVARVELPKPIAPSELNKRRTYPTPTPYALYWPKGFVTDIPLSVQGDAFSIDVPLADAKRAPGLYEISVWSKLPGNKDHTMIGLRTVLVE
jgi:uncharacterized protein YkwD